MSDAPVFEQKVMRFGLVDVMFVKGEDAVKVSGAIDGLGAGLAALKP